MGEEKGEGDVNMIYVRFEIQGRDYFGVLSGKTIREITPDFFSNHRNTGRKFALKEVKLLAPVLPGKIVALGLNYMDHAKEMGMVIPPNPLIFLKPSTAVIGPGDKILYPKSARQVDYEGELGIVIGRRCKNVNARAAAKYILGYTCVNDVTARDLQSKDGQWTRAKSFDTFAPIGPWIVSGINPGNLKIESFLNGKRRQNSNTKNLIFKVEEIVSFVSGVMTLLPGDVIATGTPPDVGPMKRGDTVKVKIGKIGELVNKVA
jgi:2-keto-4-pentenoate hydratase/2-oxohepta-3-ene-1,7-dioic acid hydratase in catechol pathway